MDDPAWRTVPGYHHFAANYQLVNDNLLDLSHESFVHEETIGNESVAESPASVTLEGDTVRMHRDMLHIEAPPFYQRTTGFAGRINRWHTNTFTPPSGRALGPPRRGWRWSSSVSICGRPRR